MFLLKEKIIGLDIADHTIEAAELVNRQGNAEVISLSRIQLEPGVVERGRIRNEEKLSQAITALFTQAKPRPFSIKNINFALPNSQLFSHIFHLKNGEEGAKFGREELEEAIADEAKTSIPINEKELIFSYKILSQKENELEILLIASDRQVVLEWKNFFAKQKLNADYFDVEILATFRGIFNKIPQDSICVVDMGASATNISIFNGVGLHYSRSIGIAGDIFSQKLSEQLKISFNQAEEIKINQGFAGQNISILSGWLEKIIDDIKESLNYFQAKTGKTVARVVLVGGSSRMNGLVEYLNAKLGLPAQLGNPEIFENKVPLIYVEAVGLAIRSFDKKWQDRDPVINLDDVAEEKNAQQKKKNFDFLYQEETSSLDRFKSPGNLRKQKIILAVVAVICVISIFGARWYKNNADEKKQQEIKAKLDQFSQTQTFDLKVPIATSEEEYTGDRARGRIVEYKIDAEKNYNDSLNTSKDEATKGLKSGEVLWAEALDDGSRAGSIKRLAYLEKDVDGLFLAQLEEMNKENIDYMLNGIEKISIEPTSNRNIVYLHGRLTISAQKLIEVAVQDETAGIVEEQAQPDIRAEEAVVPSANRESQASNTPPVSLNTVLITDTPTGWLNVRQGPGPSYNIVFKVNPGESYEALELDGNWQKIKKSDGQEGWVSVKYIQAR